MAFLKSNPDRRSMLSHGTLTWEHSIYTRSICGLVLVFVALLWLKRVQFSNGPSCVKLDNHKYGGSQQEKLSLCTSQFVHDSKAFPQNQSITNHQKTTNVKLQWIKMGLAFLIFFSILCSFDALEAFTLGGPTNTGSGEYCVG